MSKWPYSDSLELELVVKGFECRDLLVEWREVGRENTLETGRQVIFPPHLPQAEHTVLTAHQLGTKRTHIINMIRSFMVFTNTSWQIFHKYNKMQIFFSFLLYVLCSPVVF